MPAGHGMDPEITLSPVPETESEIAVRGLSPLALGY